MTLLPDDIQTTIRARAHADWPADPAMQQYMMERQAAAYLQFVQVCEAMEPSAYSMELIEFARQSWPDDFEMALHTLKRQLACSKEFFEYTRPRVPADILQQMKEKAFEDWPGDYEMKLHMLEAALDAWLAASAANGQLASK